MLFAVYMCWNKMKTRAGQSEQQQGPVYKVSVMCNTKTACCFKRNFMYCTMQPQTVYIASCCGFSNHPFPSSFIWTFKGFLCLFYFFLWKMKTLNGWCGIACRIYHSNLLKEMKEKKNMKLEVIMFKAKLQVSHSNVVNCIFTCW